MTSAGGRNTHNLNSSSRRGSIPVHRAGEVRGIDQACGVFDTPPFFTPHKNMVNTCAEVARAKTGQRVLNNIGTLTFIVTAALSTDAALISLAFLDVIRVEAVFAGLAGVMILMLLSVLMTLAVEPDGSINAEP
jgi:hypothetical protein